jgi:IclR family KDG regulon transcriptional repressor
MSRQIQSLARGLNILALLADADEPMGLTEIAQKLSVDKSTAFHLLRTLASNRFAEQDPKDRRYTLGLRVVELSRRALDRIELRTVAKPCLKLLQQRVGESAHLAVLGGGHVVYVDNVASDATLNVHTEIGHRAPSHCTAIGKALIAWLSPEDLKGLVDGAPLTRFTPRTITTLRELIPHLETVRERGYAVDDEEFDAGVRCVATAVRDYRGEVVASVGISGPTVRLTLERMAKSSWRRHRRFPACWVTHRSNPAAWGCG